MSGGTADPILFRATLSRDGATATGITVPVEVLAGLGGGKRPAVQVTIRRYTFRTTVGSMGGHAKIPVSAAVREAAGVVAGDELEVLVEPDPEPGRVDVPADLAAALASRSGAQQAFDALPRGARKAHVASVESAKTAATRERRITAVVTAVAPAVS